MSLSHSTDTSKPVQTVSLHTIKSDMMTLVKSNASQTNSSEDKQQQPLPKASNHQQHLTNGSNQQQHLTNGSNQQQPLSKGSNQQQPLPKGSHQQQALTDGSNHRQPLPKSSSTNDTERTYSKKMIPQKKSITSAHNTDRDAASGSQKQCSRCQNTYVPNINNCSVSRVSPKSPLSSNIDSKSTSYGAAATVDSRAAVKVTDSVVTIQPGTESSEAPMTSIPDTHLTIGILVTCCFISPFGIAAMYFSLRATAAYRDGFDKKGASRTRTSIILSLIGITVTMLIIAGFVCYISVNRHRINKEAPQTKNALGF